MAKKHISVMLNTDKQIDKRLYDILENTVLSQAEYVRRSILFYHEHGEGIAPMTAEPSQVAEISPTLIAQIISAMQASNMIQAMAQPQAVVMPQAVAQEDAKDDTPKKEESKEAVPEDEIVIENNSDVPEGNDYSSVMASFFG